MTEISEKVRELLGDLVREDVTPDQNLHNDLGLDDLDHIEMVMAFEEAFGVSISDEAMDKWRDDGTTTVKDLVDYIEAQQ